MYAESDDLVCHDLNDNLFLDNTGAWHIGTCYGQDYAIRNNTIRGGTVTAYTCMSWESTFVFEDNAIKDAAGLVALRLP